MTSSDSIQHGHPADEAMTDVLSSIRRILHDDPNAPQVTEEKPNVPHQEEELTLDNSMMIARPVTETAAKIRVPAPEPTPAAWTATTEQTTDDLMNAQTMASAERSLDELHAAFSGAAPLASDTVISRGSGLTIEDMVRGEVRSMVRTWLDAHLPSLVEILVRAEIARLRPRE